MRVDKMLSGMRLGAVVAVALYAGAAFAAPITPTTHYNLGKSPYLTDATDATTPDPGVNTPNDPVVGLHNQNFIPLGSSDYTVTPTSGDMFFTAQDPGDNLNDASLATPILFDGSFTIEWNGTIGGLPYQDALEEFELCNDDDACDLMKVEGEVKFLFAIWDIRWATDWEQSGDSFWNEYLEADAFDHGLSDFESGDPGDPLLTGELLVDDSVSRWLPEVDSGDDQLHVDHGVGVKFAMDMNDPYVVNNLFSLGENVDDICSLDDCRIAILWDVFVYTVPEPATVLLALSGVLGLGIAGSRRRP